MKKGGGLSSQKSHGCCVPARRFWVARASSGDEETLVVGEKKVKSEHFCKIQNLEEKVVTNTHIGKFFIIRYTLKHTLHTNNNHTHLTTSNINMMLTTSLRPFHVLDASLAAELEDMFLSLIHI